MADMVTKQELEAAKIDVKNAGEAVNEEKVVKTRLGRSFKSIPLIVKEGEAKITQAAQTITSATASIVAQKNQASAAISEAESDVVTAATDVHQRGNQEIINLQNAIDIAAAAGAGENGWTDKLIVMTNGGTLDDFADKQSRKNQELKTLSDFNDDLSLVLKQSNTIISGGMKTILLTSIINAIGVKNLTIRDVIVDCSTITNTSGNAKRIISFSGTQAASKLATQDALYNQNKFYCNTSGLAVKDLVFIQADNIIVSPAVKPCQYARIIVVNADHVVLDTDTLYSYTVDNSARLSKVTPAKGINFENAKFIGAQAGLQNALFFDMCEDCHADITVDSIDYAGVEFKQSINCTATGTYSDAQATGLAYGVAIMNGCHNVRVVDSFGENLRHHVTVGGSLINNFCGAYTNHARNCRDAGYDSHGASNFFDIHGNTVECTRGEIQPKDGIITQGLNSSIKDCEIVGAYTHSVVAESYAAEGVKNSVTIQDIECFSSGSPASGTSANVHIFSRAAGGFESVAIQGVSTDGGMEFAVFANADGGDINNLTIQNNPKLHASLYKIYLLARSGRKINGFNIQGNTTLGSGEDIMAHGLAKSIIDGTIANNRFKGGGAYNIRLIECDDVNEYNNKCSGAISRRLEIENSTNIRPAINQGAVRTVTASNTVVTIEDFYIVVNRPSGANTVILYDPSMYSSRHIIIKNKTDQPIVSASANIEQHDGSISNAILSGRGIVHLRTNGAQWFIA